MQIKRIYFYRPQTKLQEGNVLTLGSNSVHRGEGVYPSMHLGRGRQLHSPEDTYAPRRHLHPQKSHTPPVDTHTPSPQNTLHPQKTTKSTRRHLSPRDTCTPGSPQQSRPQKTLTPPPEMATEVSGAYPTGMHTCSCTFLIKI